MAIPTSQKAAARPISFLLEDQSSGIDMTSVTLNIRPEDLTRVEPSRLAVQQTLGGAWLDNFGVGVRKIVINGHTGWRGGMGEDGMAAFKTLNNTVFKAWHEKRRQAIAEGRDPSDIRLIFADLLDDFVYVVSPDSFVLRRNKARPLLMQYQISMTVLSEDLEDLKADLMPPDVLPGLDIALPEGLGILREILGKIRGFAQSIADFITGTIGAVAREFMELTASVLEVVTEVVDSIKGSIDIVVDSLISVAADLAQAGKNIMSTIAAVASLPGYIKSRIMEVAGAFSYAFCILKNAFRSPMMYDDYSDWFGANNCSSLNGGRPQSPLRFENPFYRLAPTSKVPVTQTPEARSSMLSLASLDVIGALPDAAMEVGMRAVVSGTNVLTEALAA